MNGGQFSKKMRTSNKYLKKLDAEAKEIQATLVSRPELKCLQVASQHHLEADL